MYSPDSSFLSAPVSNPQTWADAIRPHNAGQADAIAAAYFLYGAQIGINADLAIAQGIHESGWFTSLHWVEQFNACGLGVTGPGVSGATFADIDDGVKAHYEHLVCYTMLADPPIMQQWGMLDPRHFMHEGFPDLAGLERSAHWAFPGTGYVESIVSIANSIGGTSVSVPWDRVHISADLGPERTLDSIKWGIVHDTEGHFDGDELVLTSAGPPVESANILIGREPGQCVLIAPLTTTAWAAGNDGVGEQAFQVELSKATNENDYTDYQYTKLAECFRYARAQGMVNVPFVYLGLHPADANGGPEPDDAGIIGHAGVPNPAGLSASPPWGGFGGHTDPGPDFDWPRFIGMLGNAPPPADGRFFPLTGRTIKGNIKGYWERFSDDAVSLDVFGMPITDLVTENGLPVQYFERQVLEDHGGRVEGRREGAAAAQAAGYTGPGIP